MSAGTPAAERLVRRRLSPREVSLAIVFLVFFGTLAVRHLGWLQFLEFRAYDFFIQHQTRAKTSDPIVLVEMTEADIRSPAMDYPIWDNKLAELFRILEADQPVAIGYDIWRDVPVPKSGEFLPELNEVLKANTNIIMIFTLGGTVNEPAVLTNQVSRIAFNDNFEVDDGVDHTVPKVRRALLYGARPTGGTFESLPFSLALLYLGRQGIEPETDPAGPGFLLLGKSRLQPFQPNDGAYVRAKSHDMQMLLDYKCPDQFTRYTFSQAFARQIPKGSLHNKIVLVGTHAASVEDERVSPLSHAHRGVEMQALILNQLLRQALDGDKPLRFWSDWVEDLWILVWCVLGGAMGYSIRSPWRLVLSTLGCILALVAIVWFAFAHGWWLLVAAPAAAFVPAASLVISYVSYQENKQRSQLMQIFARQVSPDIAQALWKQREEFLAGQRPRSQKLTATVLFTDLVGFTSTSERLEPALLMDWLNEYMEEMATAIMYHQGVVEKYIGDAVMAVFGAPLPRTTPEEISEDACNAVRCALVMRKKLDELNQRWIRRELPCSSMRVGIHTGPLVAGSLGSTERQEYTVIGDSVNTASRLESFEKDYGETAFITSRSQCRILISEATYRLLNGKFRVTEVGKMSLKNKMEPVNIFEVLDSTD